MADYKLALSKGMVNKTMFAAATPSAKAKWQSAPDTDVFAEAESDAEAETDTPRPILASLAPPVIAEDPHEPGTPPAKLFTYASAGGMSVPFFGHKDKAPKPAGAPLPSYRDAEVVSAPEADDDHPDALAYVPFEIAGLMTDASVTYSRTVAPLSPPDQQNLDYLFDDMDQPTALTLRKSSGYVSLAAAQRFSGQAIRSIYAEVQPQAAAPTSSRPEHPLALPALGMPINGGPWPASNSSLFWRGSRNTRWSSTLSSLPQTSARDSSPRPQLHAAASWRASGISRA